MSPAVPVDRITPAAWWTRGRCSAHPVVVAGAYPQDPGSSPFTPTALRAAHPDVPVAARRWSGGVHRVSTVPLARFLDRLHPDDLYQAPQLPLAGFAGLADALDLAATVAPPVLHTFLWIAVDFRLPYHYDVADNVVVQLFGERDAVLSPPGCTAARYLRPNRPTTSAVNPRAVDRAAFPDYDDTVHRHARMRTGDALFVPRGWFHDLAGDGVSVAVNAWRGPRLPAPPFRGPADRQPADR